MSLKHRGQAKGHPVTYQTPLPAGGVQMETFLPWTLVRRGLKKQIITPLDAPQEFLDEARRERQVREMAQDTPLMRALGLAHHWQRLLDEGRFSSMTEIAAAEGIDLGQASKMKRQGHKGFHRLVHQASTSSSSAPMLSGANSLISAFQPTSRHFTLIPCTLHRGRRYA